MGYSDFTFVFSTKSTGNLDEDVLNEFFPSSFIHTGTRYCVVSGLQYSWLQIEIRSLVWFSFVKYIKFYTLKGKYPVGSNVEFSYSIVTITESHVKI